MDKATLKNKLYDGKICLGTWLFLPSPDVMEMVGLAGFDFAVIDMEHSAITFQDAVSMMRAAECRNLVPLLRVSWENKGQILRGLDSGAHGMQLPHIETVDDVVEAVRYIKYHPAGERGLATTTRGGGYTLNGIAEHVKAANAAMLLVISLESKESFTNLDAMLEIQELDVVYIGPYDLSQSLGRPGEVDHPQVLKAMEANIKKIREGGKIAGSFARTAARARQLKDMGVTYLTCESDGSLIRSAFERVREDIFGNNMNTERKSYDTGRQKRSSRANRS